MDQAEIGAAPLLAEAVARTGLDDFGSDSLHEGLGFLTASVREGGASGDLLDLHRKHIADALDNRLRLIDYAKRHPEVTQAPISRPIFRFGMPRSGTTLSSYLMDQDPAHRSLLLWEALDSVPPPTSVVATIRAVG